MSRIRASFILPITAAFLVACGGGDAPPPETAPSDTESAAATADIAFAPLVETAPPAPNARLRIVSPTHLQRFAEGEPVEVRFELEGYEVHVPTPTGDERGLARAPMGQHVHLIVNDRPYLAIYDMNEPVVIDDLPAGTHAVRAFPGRDWHESVKVDGAFAQIVFVVGDGDPEFEEVSPTLVYSRPQGPYEGADADSVLVDFFAHGIEFGADAYNVIYTLNDEQRFTADRWAPYVLTGLPAGSHTLRMELRTPDGVIVNTPFLPVERTFEIRR